MIRIRCRCGEVFHAGEEQVGRRLRCRCGRTLEVRLPPSPSAAAPPSAPHAARTPPPSPERRSRPAPSPAAPRRTRAQGAGHPALNRWVTWLSLAYLGLALAAWAAVWLLAERWWPATVYLFGPRWILILPLAVLVPLAALLRPRLLWVLGLAGAIVLFPVMGVRTGWRALLPAGGDGVRLRVVSLNAAARDDVGNGLAPLLLEWEPDLVGVQECGDGLAEALAALPGWHFHGRGQLCLLSRYPIAAASVRERGAMAAAKREGIGGSGLAVRYRIRMPQGPVQVVNLHLETPRKGLSGVMDGDASRMAGNTLLREIESRQIARWVGREDSSLIVLGDFNMPVESRIYRSGWGHLANAFSRAGHGIGWTRDNGWIRVRIDHVLTGDAWRARRAWVGPDVGSDHRPVAADLRWTGGG